MSEQKYYVKIKPKVMSIGRKDGIYGYNIDNYGFTWLDRDCEFFPDNLKHPFTKTELAVIMDGALYKRADYCEFMELPPDWVMNDKTDRWLCEWINPLIELVPIYEV